MNPTLAAPEILLVHGLVYQTRSAYELTSSPGVRHDADGLLRVVVSHEPASKTRPTPHRGRLLAWQSASCAETDEGGGLGAEVQGGAGVAGECRVWSLGSF